MEIFNVEEYKTSDQNNILDYFITITPEGSFYHNETEYLEKYEQEFLDQYNPNVFKISKKNSDKNHIDNVLPDQWLELINKLSGGLSCIISHDTMFKKELKYWFKRKRNIKRVIKRKNRHAPVLVECTQETFVGEDSAHIIWFPGVKGYVLENNQLGLIKKLTQMKKLDKDDVFEFLSKVQFIFTPINDEQEMLLLSNNMTVKHIKELIAS